jgi:hypothetical protein
MTKVVAGGTKVVWLRDVAFSGERPRVARVPRIRRSLDWREHHRRELESDECGHLRSTPKDPRRSDGLRTQLNRQRRRTGGKWSSGKSSSIDSIVSEVLAPVLAYSFSGAQQWAISPRPIRWADAVIPREAAPVRAL